jgi:two-component sensor histidine kinase
MLNSSTGDHPMAGRREEPRSSVAPATLQAALDQVTRESEEKTLLLSELRHRMKNNLQTVQSLLRLQKSRTLNFSARSELAHLEMQIAALNGVDGELLVTEAKQLVDLSNYLRRLLAKLKDAFGASSALVSFRVDLDAVEVPCRTAANLGLLVNEAVTNSFKHAVPNGATEIGVALKLAGRAATLIVSDNGPGFQGPNQRHAGGTILMKRLAERAGATVVRDLDWRGTRYIVRLPLLPAGVPSTR